MSKPEKVTLSDLKHLFPFGEPARLTLDELETLYPADFRNPESSPAEIDAENERARALRAHALRAGEEE